MSDISSKLIQYLLNNGDFSKIAEDILHDVREDSGTDALYLMQLDENETTFSVIVSAGTGIFTQGQCVSVGDAGTLIEDGIVPMKGGKAVFFPIYILDKAVMFVCGFMTEGEFTEKQLQQISHMTIIIQSIAARKNNDDSLEYSYALLEKVLDEVYSGVAVLDCEENDIFFINRMARESEAMQSAIGKVLKGYDGTGECSQEEVADETTGTWYDVHISSIMWINGKNAILCTALDVTQKVKNLQSARYQIYNDYLTGIFNRKKCENDLSELLDQSIKGGLKGALIYLDLDDFKQVNDRLGHQYGDVLLQDIAGTMKGISQIAGNCYRLGGDEFVIIIRPDVYCDTERILSEISERFARPWDLLGVNYYCTMSMGIAVFPDDGISGAEILGKADYAMYEAKKGGKNRYLWYKDADMTDEINQDNLKDIIGNAAENNMAGFETVMRNVVDADGRIIGTKVLSAPKGYTKSGEALIMQYAEYMGIASKLGTMTYENACLMAATGKAKTPLFVAVHPSQMMKKNIADELDKIASESEVRPDDIVLEIAEDDEMRDENRVVQNIEKLKEKGFGIGLYNFGKGRMSIDRIIKYSASTVCLCDDFDTMDNTEVLGKALKEMSKSLGFTVCMEDDC